MIRSTLLLAFFALTSICLNAQVGSLFPKMITEDLDGNDHTLPATVSGKFALIGIATTAKAEKELRTWQRPVYNTFIAKTGLMDQMWDVEVKFMPVFTGAAKAAKGSVVKKLKENNEKLVIDHLLIYDGDKQALESLNIEALRKEPHFFLLNEVGSIVWHQSGAFRQKYLDEIVTILSQ